MNLAHVLQVNFAHVPDKRLITGTSGTGKTTLFIELIRERRSRGATVLVFDHEAEFCQRLKLTPALTVEQLNRQVVDGVAVFDPVQLYPGQLPKAFAFFCDYAFFVAAKLRGEKLLCCDELQKLIGTDTCPQELANVLETGRRYGLDFLCNSQSPNLIHTRVRNQLTKVYTFRQADERSVKFLEEAGFNPEAVRALPRGSYIWRDLNTGQMGNGIVFKPPTKEKKCPGVSTPKAARKGLRTSSTTKPTTESREPKTAQSSTTSLPPISNSAEPLPG